MSTLLPFTHTAAKANYLNVDYGWKSWLLKAVDPWFRRNGKTVVPLRIEGTRAAPKFGVDVGRALRRSADSPEQHRSLPPTPSIPSFNSH